MDYVCAYAAFLQVAPPGAPGIVLLHHTAREGANRKQAAHKGAEEVVNAVRERKQNHSISPREVGAPCPSVRHIERAGRSTACFGCHDLFKGTRKQVDARNLTHLKVKYKENYKTASAVTRSSVRTWTYRAHIQYQVSGRTFRASLNIV